MFELLRADMRRWLVPGEVAAEGALTLRTALRLLWQHLPVRAMVVFRLAGWFKQHDIPFFPGFLQRVIYRRYGLEIPCGADIGGGLYIAHPVGTVIMPKRIGRNCSIIASVTVGMRSEWSFPDIGDNVYIGAGARILGGIRIGNDVSVGANAVVIHDAPDGATVVGVPARVIRVYARRVEETRS